MPASVGNITALNRRDAFSPKSTPSCDPSCHETPKGLDLSEIRRESPDSTVILHAGAFSSQGLIPISDSETHDTDDTNRVIENVRKILAHRLQNYPGAKNTSMVMEIFSSIFDRFFGLDVERKPQIEEEELKTKLSFVEELLTTIPNNVPILNLEKEYSGYQIYKKSPFQKSADDFVGLMDGPLFNNYKTRGRVAQYLELRYKVSDLARGKKFLKDLIILKTEFNVQGVDRLLKLAHGNELSFGKKDNVDSAHGFYGHADLAVLLAKAGNLKVEDLAVRRINQSGQTRRVPYLIGDIDIVASDSKTRYFIEVKSSVNGANGSLEQLDSFVNFAQRYRAVPVLLLGNIETPDLAHLDVYRTVSKRDRVLKDIKNAIELVNRYNGELRIWNGFGRDINKTLMDYVKDPKAAVLFA